MRLEKLVLILPMLITTALCNCPIDRVNEVGNCSFRIYCNERIKGISLPDRCQESTNDPVNVDLNVENFSDNFDGNESDLEFLTYITILRVHKTPVASGLIYVKYMPRLREAHISGNDMKGFENPKSPFYTSYHLEIINLSKNKLTNIDNLFHFNKESNKVKYINLSQNQIPNVSSQAFKELFLLKMLDLSHNRLVELNKDMFSNLTNLETLKLSYNNIKNLNGALNKLHSLEHLYVRGNDIRAIETDAQNTSILVHLKTFDMSENKLENLKSNIFLRYWKNFEEPSTFKINLSANQISFIPNPTALITIERHTRGLAKKHMVVLLTELDLSRNGIVSIERNAFNAIINLIYLDLSCNKLKSFDVNNDDLFHIKRLNLSNNEIDSLNSTTFVQMHNLQSVDLSKNHLAIVPSEIFIKSNFLNVVNLSFNKIRCLNDYNVRFSRVNGGTLDLSSNSLSIFNVSFNKNLHITTLILKNNNITDLELINLNDQLDMKVLDVSHNLIKELNMSSLKLPYTLRSLDLSFNSLKKIYPSTFWKLGHLSSLKLAHNNLKNIQFGTFQNLKLLHDLDLSYNNISALNSKVMVDLKSLKSLKLNNNNMCYLEYKYWIGHKNELSVYLDGNLFDCEWLSSALNDYENGYSKMRPESSKFLTGLSTVAGIECIPKSETNICKGLAKIQDQDSERFAMVDERLLITSQKILESIKEQTWIMKKLLHDRERDSVKNRVL